MVKLSKAEKERVIALIEEGKPLALKYRSALFAGDELYARRRRFDHEPISCDLFPA